MNLENNPAFTAAMDWARSLEAVTEKQPSSPGVWGHFSDDDASNKTLRAEATLLAQANRMRHETLSALTRTLEVLSDPSSLNMRRLYDPATQRIRKPRVALWAAQNQRGTLEILWSPVFDPLPRSAESSEDVPRELVGTDYVRVSATWPFHGARGYAVLRFMQDEYVSQPPYRQTEEFRGHEALKEALTGCLDQLLKTLGVTCDVFVGDWPVYSDEGVLRLESAGKRAETLLEKQRAKLEPASVSLAATVASRFAAFGVEDEATLLAAEAEAASTQTKVSAVLFKRTGRRCTVTQVATWRSSAAALAECRKGLDDVLQALTYLKHRRGLY